MKTIIFVSLLLLSGSFGFTLPNQIALTECPAPANVTITSKGTSSVSFAWDDCGCGQTGYRVLYERGGQYSQVYLTGSSNISFSGLPSGAYRFYFYTVCGEGVSSIIIDDVVIG